MSSRPKTQSAGPYRARAIRGPQKTDNRWYWRVERYQAGKGKTCWTGWATIEEVQRVCAELLLNDGARLKDPTATEPALTVDLLFRRWVAYQEDRGDLRPASVECCREAGKRFASSSLAQVRVDRVERSTLDAWIASSLRAGRASRTLAHDLGKLNQAWRWAREVGMIDARELPRVRLVVRPSRESYTPTPGEVGEVVRELRRRGLEHHAIAVEVLAATGVRRGELLSLRKEGIVRRGKTLLLHVRGKTGPRVVPILEEPLAARLEAWAAAHQPPFSGNMHALEKVLAELLPQLKQPHWSMQGLRRQAVDRLYSAGSDPGAAAAILGHSAKVALAHYRRAGPADIEDAIRRAGLGKLPEGEVIEFRPAQGTRTGE